MKLDQNGHAIQDVSLIELCRDFGTPLYVYDTEKITSQIKTLKNAFSGYDFSIKYAIKAQSNLSIISHIREQGCGADVVSLYEAQLAIKAGFKPQDIIFTSNCVDFDEIIKAVEMGLVVNIDSLPTLEMFGEKYKDTYPCCIRINPHIMAGYSTKVATGSIDSKFGISIFQLPQLMNIVRKYRLIVNGLHVHTGSEIEEIDVFLRIAKILFDIASEFPSLKFIDLGSGFKVSYRNGEAPTNVYDLGLKLGKIFRDFYESYGTKLALWMEPGKYLVSESGYLLASVNVVKATPVATFASINSGFNQFIRPMMYGAYHEIVNISNTEGIKKTYIVVGNLCETDTFGANRKLHEVSQGDIIAIKNAGAYGYAMASHFNSRPKPAEVMIKNGQATLIRRRETFDDLISTQQ